MSPYTFMKTQIKPLQISTTLKLLIYFLISILISSNPFTPCGAQGIHEELPGIAVSIYPIDLLP